MAARPPSLRSVVAFEAAARHESFVKAAEELNLTQSAVSHAVRGLEARVGHALFDRPGRAVVLTVHGARLANRVRVALSLLSDALEQPTDAQPARLVVGASPQVAQRVLSHRLGRFRTLHPSVQIELRCDASAFSPCEVDVMIQGEPGASPGFASRPLVQQQLFAVAGPAFRGAAEAHALPTGTLIESPEWPWSLWFGRLGRRGPAGSPAITVDDEGAAIEMARAGVGVCLARSALVQDDLRAGSLVRVGSAETPVGALHLVWSVRSAKGVLAQTFMSWLSEDLTAAGALAPAPLLRDAGLSSSLVSEMLLAAASAG